MATATDPAFLRFLAAIKQQESGGNYTRVSDAGAVGAYQVMPANVGPWASQALGHSVTVEEFAQSPQLQDEIASYELLRLYNRYGVRGAASAWYSGDPSLAGDYAVDRYGQSPGKYADEITARMAAISPKDAQNMSSTGTQQWASPGHWFGANGQPIADPPTPVTYDNPAKPKLGNGGGPILPDSKATAKAKWSDATWGAVIQWLIQYGGTSSQDGPKLAAIRPPYSDNDKGFVFDLYAHTVTSQPRGKGFNPSTGEAIPGAGPVGGSLSRLLGLLLSGTFWKRIGVGALGVVLLLGMALWLERDKVESVVKSAVAVA